jgi:hypothetical protein
MIVSARCSFRCKPAILRLELLHANKVIAKIAQLGNGLMGPFAGGEAGFLPSWARIGNVARNLPELGPDRVLSEYPNSFVDRTTSQENT